MAFGKMIVLRMGNLQDGEIDWNDLAYSDDEADIKKYLFSKGDVLFNRTNSAELVGKTSIYRGEYPAMYAGYLIKLDYDRCVLSGEYLNYVLASDFKNHPKKIFNIKHNDDSYGYPVKTYEGKFPSSH